jgi:hypothetical protein
MSFKSVGSNGLRANSMSSSSSTARLPPECQPEDIVRDLQQLQVSRSHTSKVQRFIKNTRSLVNVVHHYAKAIDIASNACPEMLCPLWAPLRALLNVSEECVALVLMLATDSLSPGRGGRRRILFLTNGHVAADC